MQHRVRAAAVSALYIALADLAPATGLATACAAVRPSVPCIRTGVMFRGGCVGVPRVRHGDCLEHDAVGAFVLMLGTAPRRSPATADTRLTDVEPRVQGCSRVQEMCTIASGACMPPIPQVSVMLRPDMVWQHRMFRT